MSSRVYSRRAVLAGSGAAVAGLAVTGMASGMNEGVGVSGLLNWVASERGIAMTRAVAFGPAPRHRLDIYQPDPAIERRPVVMFIYGGGWTSGERATYAFVGTALAAQGYRTVIADYRLHPEVGFPTFVDDAETAYRWITANIRDTSGAARPIFCAGHSAGAYIAAMLALDGKRAVAKPAGLIGLAGPYSFDPTTWPTTKHIFANVAGQPDRARPVAFARADAPPTLLQHGLADTTVKLYNTADLAAALRGHQSAVEQIDYPGIGHVGLVTAIARPLRWRAPVLADMLRFLSRHGGETRLRT